MTIDLERALRRQKPEKRLKQLKVRPRAADAAEDVFKGEKVPLLVDTNVYINDVAGRLTSEVAELLDRALLFHCSVCIAELAIGIANGDPLHEDWSAVRDYYVGLVGAIPSTRLLTPDSQIWAEAGLIAGTLARTQGYQPHQRRACLNDALILLSATKGGLAVLTSNRDAFDLIQQLVPEGRFVGYRI